MVRPQAAAALLCAVWAAGAPLPAAAADGPDAGRSAAAAPAAASVGSRLLAGAQWLGAHWHQAMEARFAGRDGAPLPLAPAIHGPGAPGWAPCLAESFELRLTAARRDGSPAALQAFYDGPWRQWVVEALPQEEAALQMVAHIVAYLPAWPGMVLPLAVREALAEAGLPRWPGGSPVDYAAANEVVATLPQVGAAAPLVAAMLLPAEGGPGPALIVFRGTQATGAPRRGEPALPSGLGEDLDPAGVGHTTFAANRDLLHAWVAAAQDDGRGVVLIGHSLGGALATRLMASLPPQRQERARLLAFAPAGVEEGTAARIVAGLGNVKTILHGHDLVTSCGERLPPGVFLQYGEAGDSLLDLRHHTRPALAHWILGWGPDPQVRLWAGEDVESGPMLIPEMVRVGLLAPLYAP